MVDQLDVLAMQNWSHLQVKWTHFAPLFASISDILDSSSFHTSTSYQKNLTTPTSHASNPGTWTDSACVYHELGNYIGIVTSFSAPYLRQSILLSSYETPETRSLFNKDLKNVAGKTRTQAIWSPVQVPEGIQQVCSRIFVFTISLECSL